MDKKVNITYENENEILNSLKIECGKCFGFCCAALYFSKAEGFPYDKEAGKPCINLQKDFKCKIHESLSKKGLKGCIAYDCFGAGQKTAQVIYKGCNYIENPELAQEMFDVFLIIRQLHEIVWYLMQALMLENNIKIKNIIEKNIEEILKYTNLESESILNLNLDSIRDKANVFIRNISEEYRKKAVKSRNNFKSIKTIGRRKNCIGMNLKKYDLRGADFRGALLIAADLRNLDLSYADFIGSDVRDCDISGADISRSLFLTQAQLNTMKGDRNTKIPEFLCRPNSWNI